MDIIQRGNPSILKSIQQGAKHISESNGLAKTSILPQKQVDFSMPVEAGAYASMHKSPENMPSVKGRVISESGMEKRLKDRLLESVETLDSTKEFFNATSSLFTLYAMGALTEGIMDSMSREDLREVKAIIREFKSTIDSY